MSTPAYVRDLGFDPERLQRVRRSIDSDIAAGRCDGVALQVTRRGELVLTELAGYADRASGRLVADDTVYATQSVGKQFITTLVLSYVERGALSLHEPVSEVLPGFGIRGKERITLRHLLTHTSGLMSAVPALPPEQLLNQAALAAFAAGSLVESVPGSRVSYSIMCASAVMAEMMLTVDGRGRSLTQLLDEELFGPLGMSQTCMGLRPDLADRLAPSVARFDEPGLFPGDGIGELTTMILGEGAELASGGYVTTLDDLTRFARMLCRGGEIDGVRILSPAMIELASRNHTGEMPSSLWDYTIADRRWEPTPACMGLGFLVRGEHLTPGPMGVLNSAASIGGFGAGSTSFWVDPARDMTFALLTTGLMEESRHIGRSRRLSDLVLSSCVDA